MNPISSLHEDLVVNLVIRVSRNKLDRLALDGHRSANTSHSSVVAPIRGRPILMMMPVLLAQSYSLSEVADDSVFCH